jgi:hypothetical protein
MVAMVVGCAGKTPARAAAAAPIQWPELGVRGGPVELSVPDEVKSGERVRATVQNTGDTEWVLTAMSADCTVGHWTQPVLVAPDEDILGTDGRGWLRMCPDVEPHPVTYTLAPGASFTVSVDLGAVWYGSMDPLAMDGERQPRALTPGAYTLRLFAGEVFTAPIQIGS